VARFAEHPGIVRLNPARVRTSAKLMRGVLVGIIVSSEQWWIKNPYNAESLHQNRALQQKVVNPVKGLESGVAVTRKHCRGLELGANYP
jgi:hypothetical protein